MTNLEVLKSFGKKIWESRPSFSVILKIKLKDFRIRLLCFSCSMNLTSSVSLGLVLTVRDRSTGLTLQPQRWPKARSIIEAPTLLHFGRTSSHQLGSSHHIVAGGTTLAVVDGQLPVLHALTTRAGHPNPLFEAQLLTAGVGGEKNQERKWRRREGVVMQRKRWWPRERSAWRFKKREREGEGERLGERAMLSTPISS